MVRKAVPGDIGQILAVYETARAFMRAHGNSTQWGNSHPAKELLLNDIAIGQLYVICDDAGAIDGCFALIAGDDPTYAYIEDGAWLSDAPYATIHRIASSGRRHGVFADCVAFALTQCPHLRVDTHRDNIPMQNAIKSQGFSYCGIIYIDDGSPRLAFERI